MNVVEQFGAAFSVEWMKFRRAPVVLVTSTLLLFGLLAICVALLYGVQQGDTQLIAKAGPLASQGGWTGLFAVASQVVPTAGMLAFGVVIGWMFGREFTDGTIVGLFARPVSRSAIALAKLALLLAWIAVVTVCLVGLVVIVGIILALGPVDSGVLALAAKLGVVGLLTGLLALVAALAATWGRGYLPAVGTTIGVVVLAVVATLVGIGGWFPFAAPGIWTVSPDSGPPSPILTIQLLIVLPVAAGMAALTIRAWRRLQL